MKKTTFLFSIVFAFISFSAFGQTKGIRVFEESRSISEHDECSKSVRKARVFNVSRTLFEEVNTSRVLLDMPLVDGEQICLVLFRNNWTTEDFSVQLKNNTGKYNHQKTMQGHHFKGHVQGIEKSLVFFSVFEQEVSAVLSIPGKGTFNVGQLEVPTKDGFQEIIYETKDLFQQPFIECHITDDQMAKAQEHIQRELKSQRASCKVVRLYAEFDYYTLDDRFNGNLNATVNYAEFLLSMVTGLYEEEEIRVKVSEMVIWETDDRYPFETAGEALTEFSYQVQNDFNGDIAALISTRRQGNGGLAWVNVLCQNYNPDFGYGPTSYSNAVTRVNQIPAYSWDVQVVTHEIGHNLGSPHTHDCFWNEDFTPIDDCAGTYNENLRGNCDIAPLPSDGTIMSYCHLVSGIGISFLEGFGPQPRDLIQQRIEVASCLVEESLVDTELSVPQERLCLGDSAELSVGTGYRYLWSTGDTESEIRVQSSGTYRVTVYDANDCSEVFQEDVLFFRGPRNELVYADTSACEGDSLEITTLNPLAPNQWSWQDSLVGQEYVSTRSEEIQLVITDSLGCSTILNLATYFKPLPDLNISVMDSLGVCPEQLAQVIIEGGDSILLIPSALLNTDSAYQLEPGAYWITSESDGCTTEDSIVITQKERPRASLAESFWICPGDSARIQVFEDQDSAWTYIWNQQDTAYQYLASMEGDITLQIINDQLCDTSITTTLEIVEVPEIISVSFAYVEGDSFYTVRVQHDASAYPLNYQWIVEDGNIRTDRNDEIEIIWNTEEDSSMVCIVLEVEGEQNCATEEVCIHVPTEIITSNIEDLEGIQEFKVFPNPFASKFEVEIRSKTKADLEIHVLDVLGRTHHHSQVQVVQGIPSRQSVITENWSEGIYFLELRKDNKRIQWVKIIKD